MSAPVTLLMVVHNHQPIGNFNDVFEKAYANAYRPFLDVLESHPGIRLTLHYSGSLLDWLLVHQPNFLPRVRALVHEGRVELLGSGYYEPILPLIPEADRQGQIAMMRQALAEQFGSSDQGLWLTERVWEPELAGTLQRAGIRYTILDVNQFNTVRERLPGSLQVDDGTFWDLAGCFVADHEGSSVLVFPASKRLRYWIPFQSVERTIDFLKRIQSDTPLAITFADDGEKFGLWPKTHTLVYEEGWLDRFFGILERERAWVQTATLREYVQRTGPSGRVRLPSGSYDEMLAWSGGKFQNFFVKYPEANAMYQKMLRTSWALQDLEDLLRRKRQIPGHVSVTRHARTRTRALAPVARHLVSSPSGYTSSLLTEDDRQGGGAVAPATPDLQRVLGDVRRLLYAGQCNCAYWHGVFGGLYLTHLRRAVYAHLIGAQQLIDQAMEQCHRSLQRQPRRAGPRRGRVIQGERGVDGPAAGTSGIVSLEADGDGRDEIRLKTPAMEVLIDPEEAGTLTEWSLFGPRVNLLDTLSRRPEPYHDKLKKPRPFPSTELLTRLMMPAGLGAARLSTAPKAHESVRSLHDVLGVKEENLARYLVYDGHRRSALVDYAFEVMPPLREASSPTWAARRLWPPGPFQWDPKASDRETPGELCVTLVREVGSGCLRKTVRVKEAHPRLECEYELEDLEVPVVALEFNLSLRDERYLAPAQQRYGVGRFEVREPASGVALNLGIDPPASVLVFPVETISESEEGLERTYQGLCLVCLWMLRDWHGSWRARLGWTVG